MSAEENKAMLRRLLDALNTGNMDVVDELFTPELAEQAKKGFTAYRSAFSDWREEIVGTLSQKRTRWRRASSAQARTEGR